jgi:hypothetical protein
MSRQTLSMSSVTTSHTNGVMERSRMKRLVATVGATVILVGLLAVPGFAQYPPEPPTVEIETPGAVIEIRGRNWGDAEITIAYKPEGSTNEAAAMPLVRVPVAADGTFSATLDRPADLPADLAAIEFTVTGADSTGREVTQSHLASLNSEPAVAFSDDRATQGSGMTVSQITLAGAILLAGVAGAIVWRRRATV